MEKVPKGDNNKPRAATQQRALETVKMEQTSNRNANSIHISTKMKRAGRSHTGQRKKGPNPC